MPNWRRLPECSHGLLQIIRALAPLLHLSRPLRKRCMFSCCWTTSWLAIAATYCSFRRCISSIWRRNNDTFNIIYMKYRHMSAQTTKTIRSAIIRMDSHRFAYRSYPSDWFVYERIPFVFWTLTYRYKSLKCVGFNSLQYANPRYSSQKFASYRKDLFSDHPLSLDMQIK